jgi:dihydroorotate dehydrogenase (NAD+) catalytic subunit
MPDISANICNIRLKNPLILASGIFGLTAKSLKRVADAGAGAVVTKSTGIRRNKGYDNPTIVILEHGILNALGLPNPGIKYFKSEIINAVKTISVPVIGSIYGSTPSEFVNIANDFEECGVSGVELNLSCPHSKYGVEIGRNFKLVRRIIKDVKKNVSIPVFVKISPELGDLLKIASNIELAGGDCITVTNTLKAIAINTEIGTPILSSCIGGYSGPALKPIGVRCVYEITQKVDIPVIGVGGILCARDVVEYLMAGARAVQIGSGIYYQGLEIFNIICKDLKKFCIQHNYKKISDFIGISHR